MIPPGTRLVSAKSGQLKNDWEAKRALSRFSPKVWRLTGGEQKGPYFSAVAEDGETGFVDPKTGALFPERCTATKKATIGDVLAVAQDAEIVSFIRGDYSAGFTLSSGYKVIVRVTDPDSKLDVMIEGPIVDRVDLNKLSFGDVCCCGDGEACEVCQPNL